MIIQKIMLISLLVINVMLLISLVAYMTLKFYMWKHKNDPPTKNEWKILE